MSDLKDGLFKAYENYSTTLRTWLVSYGIGAPVLLLSNDKIWNAFSVSSTSSRIAAAFLAGVAFQVVLASLNKYAMWFGYQGEEDPKTKEMRSYKFYSWFADRFWIDVTFDVASIILFAGATYLVFVTVTCPIK